jgi:hypothetical protein
MNCARPELIYLTDLEGDASDEPAFPVLPKAKQKRRGAIPLS